MTKQKSSQLAPYKSSLAGTLLLAREAVMAPIRPKLRAANVTEQQWRVLRVLADHDFIDAQSLAAAALLHSPSVTRIVRELSERGLIERRIDAQDGRRSNILITPQGRHLLDGTAKYTLEVLEGYGQAFGQERLDALKSELAALVKTLAPFAPND